MSGWVVLPVEPGGEDEPALFLLLERQGQPQRHLDPLVGEEGTERAPDELERWVVEACLDLHHGFFGLCVERRWVGGWVVGKGKKGAGVWPYVPRTPSRWSPPGRPGPRLVPPP